MSVNTNTNAQTSQPITAEQPQTEVGLITPLVRDLLATEDCSANDDLLVRLFSSPIQDSPNYLLHAEHRKRDIFFEAVAELESQCGNFINTRVLLQTPYESRMAIGSTWDCDAYPIFDEQWHFEADATEAFIERMLERGFNVVAPLNLLVELLPESIPAGHMSTPRTLKAGSETPTRRVTDYDDSSLSVETGHCPVCGYDAGTFGSLRGHIGGKIANGCHAHKNMGIRLEDYE